MQATQIDIQHADFGGSANPGLVLPLPLRVPSRPATCVRYRWRPLGPALRAGLLKQQNAQAQQAGCNRIGASQRGRHNPPQTP
jgi:hypothetical protein